MAATFDQLGSLSRKLAGDKSEFATPSADSLTSLNLLKGIYAADSREANQIKEIQKNESKYLLAGIAALNGPNGGSLQEMFGGADFKTASILGDLIKQRESQRMYEHTLNNCLDVEMRKNLGFDKTRDRAVALNAFIQTL